MANQIAGKAASEIPALKPDRGKLAVRNFREGDGNSGIIEARQAPLPYSTLDTTRCNAFYPNRISCDRGSVANSCGEAEGW